MEQTSAKAALAAQPETAARIEQFLANPETGVHMARPTHRADRTARETEHLLSALHDAGYRTEDIGTTVDDGLITNVLRDNEYLLTLTITRTPGY